VNGANRRVNTRAPLRPILRAQRTRARPTQPLGGRSSVAPSLRDVLTV